MSTISTYTTLKDTIADYLNRSDLTEQIETFIQLAEADIRRNLRDRLVTDAFVITGEFQALDGDIGDVQLLRYNTDTREYPLKKTTLANLATLRRSGSGTPHYYAVMNQEIFYDITPDGPYTAEITYAEPLTALSDSVTTNYTLSNSPDIYLFGALKEAEPFLEHDERNPMWNAKYEKAVRDENIARELAENGGAPVVARLPITFG